MSKMLRLKQREWLSLIVVTLALILSLFALQRFGTKTVSIKGKPHFESFIGVGQLDNPMAVAVYRNFVAVTSSADARVKLYNLDGSLFKQVKLPNPEAYPASLAFDTGGTLFIGDLADRAVYKSSVLNGSDSLEKLKIKAIQPLALAVSGDDLLVFDGKSQRLMKIGDDLKPVNVVKDKGIKIGYANGIYFDNRKLYLSDSTGRRVLRFSAAGTYTGTLKDFSLPRGLAVDGLQRLHVVDTFSHAVKVFSESGKFLFKYGKEGNKRGQFYFPNSLAIDSSKGKIFIADKGNNRVQVWGW